MQQYLSRVWQPKLPLDFATCTMEYTFILAENHCPSCGIWYGFHTHVASHLTITNSNPPLSISHPNSVSRPCIIPHSLPTHFSLLISQVDSLPWAFTWSFPASYGVWSVTFCSHNSCLHVKVRLNASHNISWYLWLQLRSLETAKSSGSQMGFRIRWMWGQPWCSHIKAVWLGQII